ncbi:hypothetical protein K438DRAFT_895282 [Mycena galopus ATCC 62051]|nr:hypothetical protein K438DRAFT_895282 [Mycena galopus ATCC 62051]
MISMDDQKVAVGWDTRAWSRFHNIWLRDHCRCSECFHPITKQILIDTFEIPPDIMPSQVEPTADGLQVSWPSSQPHISLYPWSWLRKNSCDPVLKSRETQTEKILWGSKIQASAPTATYEEAMAEDDCSLYKWLSHVVGPFRDVLYIWGPTYTGRH